MSKKNKKLSRLEKEYLHRMLIYENPFFNAEPLHEYCAKIKKEAYDSFDDCSYINLKNDEQYLPSGLHKFTEAVVMASPLYADYSWIQSGKENTTDDEFYIGKINDPVSEILKTRGFWSLKIEDNEKYHIGELQSLYTVALATTNNPNSHSDEVNNSNEPYALITGFFNEQMFEFKFYEALSINIIKQFIFAITAALKANPKKRLKDMPKKEMFTELIEKLTVVKENDSLITVNEFVNIFMRGKYSKEFKMEAIKRVKGNPILVSRVSKELNIPYIRLYQWIREYEKRGENAFPGSGMYHKNHN